MEAAALFIRFGTGITMVIYGITQEIWPASWFKYVPVWLRRMLPIEEHWLLRVHGSGNILLGVWLMAGIAPRWAAWLCVAWWCFVSIFAFYHDWREGMRDLSIAAGLVALALIV